MKQILAVLFCTVCFISCHSNSSADQNTDNIVNADSLVAMWNTAWNNNDSAAILNLMGKDIVLISEGSVAQGKDSLAKNFVGPHSKLLRNMKTNTISSGGSGNMAYYYGTYTHDVALKDTTITGITGYFSFIYAKEDNQWKIKVAEIEEVNK